IGGVANDVQPEAIAKVKWFVDQFEENLDECERLINTNRIFIERLENIGVISAEDAIDLGLTGPSLRGSGVDFDLRRATPYLFYNEMCVKASLYTEGDSLVS